MENPKHDNENVSLPNLEMQLDLLKDKQTRYQGYLDSRPDMLPRSKQTCVTTVRDIEAHLVYMRRKLDRFYRARDALRLNLHLVAPETQSRG